MVTNPLPRAALRLLSPASRVVTLCSSLLEEFPAPSARLSFVLYFIFTFHREVKVPEVLLHLRA